MNTKSNAPSTVIYMYKNDYIDDLHINCVCKLYIYISKSCFEHLPFSWGHLECIVVKRSPLNFKQVHLDRWSFKRVQWTLAGPSRNSVLLQAPRVDTGYVGLYFVYRGSEQYFTSAVVIYLTLLHTWPCLVRILRYKAIRSKSTSNYRRI